MTDLAKPLRKSVNLVDTHFEAGHDDPSSPKFNKTVIDVGSLITNARRWHDQYVAPASEREQLSYLVRNASTHQEIGTIMAAIDPINEGIASISTAVDGVAAEIAKVAGQLAGGATQAEIAAAATSLNGIASRLAQVKADADALVEVEGEDDVIEPPVEPTP